MLSGPPSRLVLLLTWPQDGTGVRDLPVSGLGRVSPYDDQAVADLVVQRYPRSEEFRTERASPEPRKTPAQGAQGVEGDESG